MLNETWCWGCLTLGLGSTAWQWMIQNALIVAANAVANTRNMRNAIILIDFDPCWSWIELFFVTRQPHFAVHNETESLWFPCLGITLIIFFCVGRCWERIDPCRNSSVAVQNVNHHHGMSSDAWYIVVQMVTQSSTMRLANGKANRFGWA